MDSLMPKPKRMDKDEQALIAQLARSFKISVNIDVYDWCELGERWSERDDTSTNVVSVRLPRLDIKYSLPLAWSVLSKIPKLEEIRLDQNDMEGGLPDTIPNSLERLYIDNNPRLGGELPQSMRFRNLSVLWLNNCGLKGQIPYSIGDMWALKHLNLSQNRLTGRLPDAWASLVLLEVLDLRQNKLKGSLPRSFRDLGKLVQLDLSYNKFSGEIPKDRFSDLNSNLKWLNLSNCNFLDSEKSHRELQQILPTTNVTVHVPKRVFVASPPVTYPRNSKYTREREEEIARLKPKPVEPIMETTSSPSSTVVKEDVEGEGDKEEDDEEEEIVLDENGIPIDINESHAENISDDEGDEEGDDDEEVDDEDDEEEEEED